MAMEKLRALDAALLERDRQAEEEQRQAAELDDGRRERDGGLRRHARLSGRSWQRLGCPMPGLESLRSRRVVAALIVLALAVRFTSAATR